ncbi:hypothetical protein B0H14DRAFT_3535924 [Mycena olivaceomarginata]|nr:hypothetical protein B0H14DRAFT_3535924 [Mycena olivaceomarginata]
MTSPLFTAVQRTLCLNSDYECPPLCPPLPRCDSPSSESDGSRSGSASPVSSGLHTTPTPSPTAESYDVAAELKGQAVIRCKTIKPLAIVKRAVSPVPSPPQPVASTSTLPAADECEEEDDDAWQDDDEYYAAHAGSFITLAPPLPPSFPASPSCESLPMSAALPSSRALHRESTIIPTALVRRSPAVRASIPIPTRAPPAAADRHLALPLPLTLVLARCRAEPEYGVCVRFMLPLTRLCLAPVPGLVTLKNARPAQDAPPDGCAEHALERRLDRVCAVWHAVPFILATFVRLEFGYPARARASGSRRCSPRPPPLPPGRKGASQRRRRASPPTSSSSSEWEEEEEEEAWEACAVSYGDAYEEVPLSPLVACVLSSPSSPLSPPSPTSSLSVEEKWSFPPSPLPLPNPAFASASACSDSAPIAGPGRYTGWHPRPRASQLRLALAVEPLSLLASQGHSPCTPAPCSSSSPNPYSAQERGQQQQCQQEPEQRALRSRWSSSTLSSVHSAHAHGRRSPGVASSPKTFAFARAAGVRRYMHFPKSASASKPKPMGSATVLRGNGKGKGKGKGGKRLTVDDVCVISPAPALAPPASPAPTPTCGATAPRQRWSYSSRASASSSRASPSGSESSDSGHSDSECGSECSGGSEGMRRKPIPYKRDVWAMSLKRLKVLVHRILYYAVCGVRNSGRRIIGDA